MADMRANGSSAMNDWLTSSLSRIASQSSSDGSARNPSAEEMKTTAPILNVAHRNVGNGFRLANGSNPRSRFEETETGNGKPSDYDMVDDAAAIDAAIDLAPPSHMANFRASQPTPASFGNLTSLFPVSSGDSGNSWTYTNRSSPMLFASSPFPRRDGGNLLRHGPSVGHSTIPSIPSRTPAAGTNIATSHAEITPEVLLSLEDVLNRAGSAEQLQPVHEEDDKGLKNDGAEMSSFNEKMAASKSSRSKVRRNQAAVRVSAEEKRRIRAERNRESAERSRLRQKQRSEELERDVYNLRIQNRDVRNSVDAYYAQLQAVANIMEREMSKEEAMSKLPDLYEILKTTRSAIEKCEWTYGNRSEPEIPLKINSSQSRPGSRPQHPRR